MTIPVEHGIRVPQRLRKRTILSPNLEIDLLTELSLHDTVVGSVCARLLLLHKQQPIKHARGSGQRP